MEGKIICAVYCRVSTNSKDQENSFENQQIYFNRTINNNPNWQLYKMYADRGLSGTSFKKREQFINMLTDAGIDVELTTKIDETSGKVKKEMVYYVSDRQPKFNLILIKNTSRFARHHLAWDIIERLRTKKVYIYFIDVGKSTENEGDALMFQFLLNIDRNDSVDKSKKIIFGMNESKKKGVIQTNGSTYGYDYNKETKTYDINNKEAENIQYIFNLYIEGIGTRRIMKILKENNIKTKKGKDFNVASIRTLLKNELYTGTLIRNRWDNGLVFNKHKPKEKPREEWIIFENAVPRIIEDEEFNKVQTIIKERTDKTGEHPKGIYTGTTKYAGKLVCAKCGFNYTSRGKHNVYNCKQRQYKGLDVCNNPNVKLSLLDENMEKLCNGGFAEDIQNIKYAYFSRLDEAKLKIIEKYDKQDQNEADLYINERKEYEDKLERLIDMRMNGNISKEQFNERKIKLDNIIEEINTKIKNITATNDEIKSELKGIDELKNKISKLNNKLYYTEDEMLEEIEKIIVYNGNNGEIYLDYIFKTHILINELVIKYLD